MTSDIVACWIFALVYATLIFDQAASKEYSIVALQRDDKIVCSVAIVDDQHILTAARCLFDHSENVHKTPLTVIAGINNTASASGENLYQVEKYYFPKDYDASNGNISEERLAISDIAVIKLSRKFDDRLPRLKISRRISDSYLGEPASFEGFKIIVGYKNRASHSHLSTTKAQIMSDVECQAINGLSILLLNGACHISVGSPLLSLENEVIGILSERPGLQACGIPNQSAIYVKVRGWWQMIEDALSTLKDVQNKDWRVAIRSESNCED